MTVRHRRDTYYVLDSPLGTRPVSPEPPGGVSELTVPVPRADPQTRSAPRPEQRETLTSSVQGKGTVRD